MELYEKIQKENKRIIREFSRWLKEKGLGEKTIRSHTSNAELFVNEYLATYDELRPHEATDVDIENFLGTWVPRKCLFASKSYISEVCAGLKKFYKFMKEQGKMDDISEITDALKKKGYYQGRLEKYDSLDPESENWEEDWEKWFLENDD
ncbi:hypothetical protein KKH56_05250 [bacterium]|nr:hypothetical protein [bacterium]